MKKLLLTFAVGAMLVSCSTNQDAEAAAEYAACFEISKEAAESAGDAADFAAMMQSIEETKTKMTECMNAWQEKFKGKITAEGFKAELKKINPEVYEMAEKQGAFDNL